MVNDAHVQKIYWSSERDMNWPRKTASCIQWCPFDFKVHSFHYDPSPVLRFWSVVKAISSLWVFRVSLLSNIIITWSPLWRKCLSLGEVRGIKVEIQSFTSHFRLGLKWEVKHLKGNQDLQTTIYKQTYLVPDSLNMTQHQTTMELMTYNVFSWR